MSGRIGRIGGLALIGALGIARGAGAQVTTIALFEDWEPPFTPLTVDSAENFVNWYQAKGAIDLLTGEIVYELNVVTGLPWVYRTESDAGPEAGWKDVGGANGVVAGKFSIPGIDLLINGNDLEFAHRFGVHGRSIDFTTINSVTLKFDAAFSSQSNTSRDQTIFFALRPGYSTSMEANLTGAPNDQFVGGEITNSSGGSRQGVLYDVALYADDGDTLNDADGFNTGNTGNIGSVEWLYSGGGTGPTMEKNGQVMSFEVTWWLNPATMGMGYVIVATSTGDFNLDASGTFTDLDTGVVVGPPQELLDTVYFAFERFARGWIDNIEVSIDSDTPLPAPALPPLNNRIEIYFQDPTNPLRNDGQTETAAEPFNLEGVAGPGAGFVFGGIDGHPNLVPYMGFGGAPVDTGEDPQISHEGLIWGGYNAAVQASEDASIATPARWMTLDGKTSNGKAGISFEDYTERNVVGGMLQIDPSWATINDGEGITKNTGSYFYTLFNRKKLHPFGEPIALSYIPDRINMDPATVPGGDPAFHIGWEITNPHFEIHPPTALVHFHFLIQTDGNPAFPSSGKWWRTTGDYPGAGNSWDQIPDAARTFDDFPTHLNRYPTAGMGWERVGAAAEADMNELDQGGETPLGPARENAGTPNLGNVTGWGIVLSSLLTRVDGDARLVAIILEGEVSGRPVLTPTPTPTPTPPPTPTPTPAAPVLEPIADQSVAVGETLAVSIAASDPFETAITLGVLGLPLFSSFVDFGEGTGEITFAPPPGAGGVYELTVLATNALSPPLTSSETFTLTVVAPSIIEAEPAALEFFVAPGFEPLPQVVTLRNTLGVETAFFAVSDLPALRIEPEMGAIGAGGEAPLTVAVDLGAVGAGETAGTISIFDGSGVRDPARVGVTIRVADAAPLLDLDFKIPAMSSDWLRSALPAPSPAFQDTTNGICMTVPGPGDNISLWVSPANLLPLIDRTVYRARLHVNTDQSDPDAIPLFNFLYDNFQRTVGAFLNYGGERWVWDATGRGGANGIGRPQGRVILEFWFAPLPMNLTAWRTANPNGSTAFDPAADDVNDMRITFRILDLGGANDTLGASLDSGTICIERLVIEPIPMSHVLANARTIYNPPLDDGNPGVGEDPESPGRTHFPNTFDYAVRYPNVRADIVNGEWRVSLGAVDAGLGLVAARLGPDIVAAGPRRDPPNGLGFANPLRLYPIPWETDALYMIRAAARSGGMGVDPPDVIIVNHEAFGSELGGLDFVVPRGADLSGLPGREGFGMDGGGMILAGAPPVGMAEEYVAFFYGNNVTLDPQGILGSNGWKAQVDLFNRSDLGGGPASGQDEIIVERLEVDRIGLPPGEA